MILKRLRNQLLSSTSNSAIGFLLTFLITKVAGVDVYGELFVILAYANVITLINIFIPPSYSVIRVQDDENFKYNLLTFYTCSSIASLFITLLVCLYYNITFAMALYVPTLIFTNLFDIYYQSKGQLVKYYTFLTLSSSFKVIAIISAVSLNLKVDLNLLITIYFIAHITLLCLCLKTSSSIDNILRLVKMISIEKLYSFFKAEFKHLKSYYLLAILKRLADSLPAILFSTFVSSYQMGIFALYYKCLTFSVIIIRNVESLLLNRKSAKLLAEKKWLSKAIVPLSQVILILVGVIYLSSMGHLIIYKLLYVSFLIYPMSYFIFARAKLISQYLPEKINHAIMISLIITTCLTFFLQDEINDEWFVFIMYGVLVSSQSIFICFNLKLLGGKIGK